MEVMDQPLDIVLVDDHDDTREVAAEVLRMEGFTVRDFPSAELALADVGRTVPCVVVSDLTLVGLGGEDLARQLRGAERTRNVALVAMTGHPTAAANRERLWDRVLIKPIDPFELARAVREVVGE